MGRESYNPVVITEALEPRLLLDGTLPGWPDGPVAGVDNGVINGQVFADADQDRTRDPAEVGLDGWTVELVDALSGVVVDTRITASVDLDGSGSIDPFVEAGLYSFTNVPTDQPVEVRIVIPDGWGQSTPKDETGGYASDISSPAADPTEDHDDAFVAVDGAGGIITVWYDPDAYNSKGVFAQRYGSDGVALGGPFQVNTLTGGTRFPEALAANASGEFVIAWTHEETGKKDVYARRYRSDGMPQGDEFLVNTFTRDRQNASAAAINDAGQAVIVWSSDNQDGDDDGVFGQRFDSDGSRLGGEFRVNTNTEGRQYSPTVAMDSDGQFVVVWTSRYQDGEGNGVFGQRYNADGTPGGGEFAVNTYVDGDQYASAVAYVESGGFVVGWEGEGPGASGAGMYLRLFDRDGEPVTDQFNAAETTDGNQSRLQVASTPDGQFAAIWSSDAAAWGSDTIVARMFDSNGVALSREFRVSDSEVMVRYHSDIDIDDSGRIVALWSEAPGSFDDSVIRLRRFDGFSAIDVRRMELADDEVVSGAYFGVYDMATASGRVFDHLQLPGDPTVSPIGVDGVKVRIYDAATGHWLGQQVTASYDLNGDGAIDPTGETGLYHFDGLKAMDYDIKIDALPGRTQQSPGSNVHHITVSYSQDITGLDFSHVPVDGAVLGQVWRDSTGDGLRDTFEPGLDGWTIELIDASTGAVVDTTVSVAIDFNGDGVIDPFSEAGQYVLQVLRSVDYQVRIVPLAGWGPTEPVSGVHTIAPGDVPVVADVDFGYQVVLGDIQGQTWHDLNADGIRDLDEPGLNGRVVLLIDVATGGTIDAKVTASVDMDGDGVIDPITEQGLYGFTGVAPGNEYDVQILDQSGWVTSTPGVIDSHVIGETIHVNETTNGTETAPVIAMNWAGQFAAVWTKEISGNRYPHARIYDADGTPISGEIQLDTSAVKGFNDVAMDDNGNLALVWAKSVSGTTRSYLQATAPDGTSLFEPIELCPESSRTDSPQVQFDAAGGVIVSFRAYLDGDSHVFFQRFALDGMALANRVEVTPWGASPDMAVAPNGSVVVAWHARPEGEIHDQVYSRVFHADDTVAVDTLKVTESVGGRYHRFPKVALDQLGGFTVGWVRTDNSTDWDVYSRSFEPDGTPLGTWTQSGTTTLGGWVSHWLAKLETGEYLLSWQDGNDILTNVVQACWYDSDGTALGDQSALLPHPAPTVVNASTVARSATGLVVGWSEPDAAGTGVYVRQDSLSTRHRFVFEAGAVHTDVDFGGHPLYAITGRVFEDVGGDGTITPTDPGVPTWPISVIDADTGVVVARSATMAIDLNGDGAVDPITEAGVYRIEGLLPGRYTVRPLSRSTWAPTLPATGEREVVLSAAQPVAAADFAMAAGASVSGRVFEDLDGDGTASPGEPGMDGWDVELVDPITGSVLATAETASRDIDGDGSIDPATEMGLYVFEGLLPGDYQVRQVGQFGWVQSLPPADGVYLVSLTYAQPVMGQEFGDVAESGEIRGQKWDDRNADGVHDADEPGLDGWTIELINADDGVVVASTVTTSIDLNGDGTIDPSTEMGLYSLGGLGRGDYVISEAPIDGWWPTAAGQPGFAMLGPDVTISFDPDVRVQYPTVAGNGQGRYVTVWTSYLTDHRVVHFRVFDDRLGWVSDTMVASGAQNVSQLGPAVAVADDGRFVIAWDSWEYDGVEYRNYIDVRGFAADGSPFSGVIRIEGSENVSGRAASIATAGDDQFIVTWRIERDDVDFIYAQRFKADGTLIGGQYQINSYLEGSRGGPQIAMNDQGESVIAWTASDSRTDNSVDRDVYARRFDSNGAPIGDEFLVNVSTVEDQWYPTVALDNTGRSFFAWRSDGRYYRDPVKVYGRVLDAAGNDVSGQFAFSTDPEHTQYAPAATVDGQGKVLVAWSGVGDQGQGLYARAFYSDGTPDGAAVRVDQALFTSARTPQIATVAPGCFTVIFHGHSCDPEIDGIQARRIYASPTRGVTLGDGERVTGIDLGSVQTAAVSGKAWEDRSLEGVLDGGEDGLDGWKVFAVDPETGFVVAQALVQSIDLDGNGSLDPDTEVGLYTLEGLLPGQYDIRLDLLDGWVQTWPGAPGVPVAVTPGGSVAGVEFAAVPEVTVEGRIFEDLDGDGAWSADEPEVDGWDIELVNPVSGEVIATTTTDSVDLDGDGLIDPATESGWYEFTGLLPGLYQLRQVLAPGWVQTLPATPEYALDLAYAEHRMQVDFATQALPSEIRGQIWHDVDADGFRDFGDIGVDGRTVVLIDQNTGEILSSQITASEDMDGNGYIHPELEQGLYAFTGLPRGQYMVRQLIGDDAQWRQSSPMRPDQIQDVPLDIAGIGGLSNRDTLAIDANESGRSVAAWWHYVVGSDVATLWARVYHLDGSATTMAIPVNEASATTPARVRVAINDDGQFVVVWVRELTDLLADVRARVYGPDGTPLSDDVLVPGSSTDYGDELDVAIGSDGSFVVTWQERRNHPGRVQARRFDATGVSLGDVFDVSPGVDHSQSDPVIAMDDSGAFTIAWSSWQQDGSENGVYARMFNADGTPRGQEFAVNTYTNHAQEAPSISMFSETGEFVIAWESEDQDLAASNQLGIYAQRYAADGTPVGGEMTLLPYDGVLQYYQPTVRMLDSGRFALMGYTSYRAGYPDYCLQWYNAYGVADGELQWIKESTDSRYPAMAVSALRDVHLIWQYDPDWVGYTQAAILHATSFVPWEVELAIDHAATGVNFAGYHTSSITGRAFDDLDLDGSVDPGESGLNDWAIALVDADTGAVLDRRITGDVDLDGDGSIDPVTETGVFAFENLSPGDYIITLGESRGLWTVTNLGGGFGIVLGEDAAVTGLNLPLADVPAPRVTSSSVLIGDEIETNSFSVTIGFDQVLNDAVLDETDFALSGSLAGGISPDTWNYDPVGSTLTLHYDHVHDDRYTLTLFGGEDRFVNRYGWTLDGELDPVTTVPSGNGIPGGPFTVSFVVDIDHSPLAPMMTPVAPLGSLVYQTQLTGWIASPADTDSYTLELNAGQMLAVVATATQSQVSVELRDESGTSVFASSSITMPELLEALPVPTSGTYTLHIGTDGTGDASYELAVVVNAAIERELYDALPNDDWASASNLDGLFIDLAGRPGGAQQAALMGLVDGWQTFTTSETEYGGLFYPNQTVLAFENMPMSRGMAEITLTVVGDVGMLDEYLDVTAGGVSIGRFVFWPPGTPSVTKEIPADTMADLLADGTVTFTIDPAPGVADEGPTEVTVTLSYPALPSSDVYSFTLAAEELVTVIASPIEAGDIEMGLYDAGGNLLVTAAATDTNVGEVISSFSAPATGEYFVRVKGDAATEYSLIVQRQAAFDIEPNDDLATAQPIGPADAVAGALDGSDDLYSISVNAGDSLTLTTATPAWHAGATASGLDPAIELYDPSGTRVAADDNGLDGRNARIHHVAESAGTYVVRIYSVAGSGEYVLAMAEPAEDVVGDIDGDLDVDAADIDRLHLLIAAGETDLRYDLSGDGIVDAADADTLIYDILQSIHGDANLSGVADLDDFVILKQNFLQSNRGWAQGDFDGNRLVDLDDCVLLKQNFLTGSQAPVSAPTDLLAADAPSGSQGQLMEAGGSTVVSRTTGPAARLRRSVLSTGVEETPARRQFRTLLPLPTDGFDLLTRVRARSFRNRRVLPVQGGVDLAAIGEDIFRLI